MSYSNGYVSQSSSTYSLDFMRGWHGYKLQHSTYVQSKVAFKFDRVLSRDKWQWKGKSIYNDNPVVACVEGTWNILGAMKSEERKGGRHARAKVAPARDAHHNRFFPFSKKMENFYWLRGSRGNKWSRWLGKKAVRQGKFEIVCKLVNDWKMWQFADRNWKK